MSLRAGGFFDKVKPAETYLVSQKRSHHKRVHTEGVVSMAFGPTMFIKEGSLGLKLRRIARDELSAIAEGLSSRLVTRYLNLEWAPTLEDEQKWYDEERENRAKLVWGIEVQGESSILVGITSLDQLDSHPVSGCVIFRKDFWGKRVASVSHIARTWYAFTQLGLLAVRSCYFDGNEASGRALRRVGYVDVGTDYRERIIDGTWRHKRNLLLVNPTTHAWDYFWERDTPPQEFMVARRRTQAVLEKTISFE